MSRPHQPPPTLNSVGLEAVSQALYTSVSRYHAHIGVNVSRPELLRLEARLLDESKRLYHEHRWEEALATFAQLLAIMEKLHAATDYACRGAIVNNIGSCLHNLGEYEAARAYYEEAIECFRKTSTPTMERLLYGDVNRRRIDWVKARLVDINWERQPEETFYLDGNGVKRKAPPAPESASQQEQTLSQRWRDANVNGPHEYTPGWMEPDAV